MHLDTVMSMVDRDTFVLYPYFDRAPAQLDDHGRATTRRRCAVTRNHSLWDTLAEILEVDEITVLTTDEDIRAAEREQWDDGTNYLAVAPGVVFGYDRNVATNTMLRKHGIEVVTVRRRRARPGPGRAALHDLPDRARPGLAEEPSMDRERHLHGRSLLKEIDFTKEEFLSLVDLAAGCARRSGAGQPETAAAGAGRNIALIFEKASTRTRAAFEVGRARPGGARHLPRARRDPTSATRSR